MGLDVGIYETKWLHRPPTEAAHDFAEYLAENATATGEGNAFVVHDRISLGETYRFYLEEREPSFAEKRDIAAWVRSLPRDEDGCISLHFNW